MSTKPDDLISYSTYKYSLTITEDTSVADVALSKRYDEAWLLARRAASLLKESFGAKKVVVFGSLAKRSLFTRWSDVDLAAWGIPDEQFYAAVGVATGLTTDFKVDLVDAQTCRDTLRRAIEAEGIEV
ncbi:Nucleotidyltransferase domain protein [Pelotomaculum schinkii]|uniref:Nucleotidyltransferase domain protein n=1 Tax=Pelotomaculum schinkii TaxID=78350 RepID=A0A4Y7RHE9_9FIRM|nr:MULTISPECIES: nucleotidyltransferase domain-containing protein [Pelotomaculum]TEB08189.1 Nucleotidyltransferase domain protein [Pelotomaculum schinkii]TEB14236.1 Nucleotidyltransferase domain protein [Pelotomaculum sp. FP]